jgi:hypothetical protein
VSATFSWTAATTTSPTETVTGTDTAGNTATTQLTLVNESTGPTGGSIDYADGTTSASSVTIGFTTGTDSPGGLNAGSGTIERRETTLANNACATGSWSSWSTTWSGGSRGANPASPFSDSWVAAGNCYQYRYTISDLVGNSTTYTGANTVKATTYAIAVASTSGLVSNWRLGDTGPAQITSAPFLNISGGNINLVTTFSGDAGVSWAHQGGSIATPSVLVADRVALLSVGSSLDYSNTVPTTADYAVEADLYTGSNAIPSDMTGVVGRLNTGTNEYYLARLKRSGTTATWTWETAEDERRFGCRHLVGFVGGDAARGRNVVQGPPTDGR